MHLATSTLLGRWSSFQEVVVHQKEQKAVATPGKKLGQEQPTSLSETMLILKCW